MASARLNRIYVTDASLITSLYKRTKERGFTTEDVMRLHWDRQGKRALEWARLRIKRMRAAGYIEVIEEAYEGDKRRKLYGVTVSYLQDLGLHD